MDVKKKVVKISVIILVILLGALAVAISLGEYIYAVHLNSAIKSKDEEAVRQGSRIDAGMVLYNY